MEQAVETYQGIVVPEPAWIRSLKAEKYGSVAGLDDEELADPDELQRQVMRQELGPVLLLPRQRQAASFRPDIDEDGFVFGAFGSVDFERCRPEFDKARYKAEKLREELKQVMIQHETVRARLPLKPAALVLKYLRMGLIELEHVSNVDMWTLGRMHLRARRIRDEIEQLEKASRRRQRAKLDAWLNGSG